MLNMIFSLALVLTMGFTGCFKRETPKPQVPRIDGPMLEDWLDSAKIDSVRYTRKIDSVLYIISDDPKLDFLLDSCYLPYRGKLVKSDSQIQERYYRIIRQKKRSSWNSREDIESLQEQVLGIANYDTLCEMCFILRVDPFDLPIKYVVLKPNDSLVYYELYAVSDFVGMVRRERGTKLEGIDKKEMKMLLLNLVKYSNQDVNIGIDGEVFTLKAYVDSNAIKIEKWCFPGKLRGLWGFFKRNLGIDLGQCY